MKGVNTWMQGRRNHHSKATKDKLRARWLGKNNPNWKPIRSERVNRWMMTEYREWRESVRRRDLTCQVSGADCSEKLEAHHIRTWKSRPDLRFEIDNGILLCNKHHDRTKFREPSYESLFDAILQAKKIGKTLMLESQR